ncbi:RNA-binding KH domain-containing protein [Striga asiatica]|uniref:RNA-binding KH domain-containing protein n=1 Tax=Striga asiatica TaxID=4170 RepID=A0A5A7PKQ8_STRAF|nr:RNA-binding KH domain-containing protein [Striga asiatica]
MSSAQPGQGTDFTTGVATDFLETKVPFRDRDQKTTRTGIKAWQQPGRQSAGRTNMMPAIPDFAALFQNPEFVKGFSTLMAQTLPGISLLALGQSIATVMTGMIPKVLNEIRFFPSYAHHVTISDNCGEMLRDVQGFGPDPNSGRAFRKKSGIPRNARLVLGVAGLLVKDKGHPLLYEAFSALQAERPDVYLIVAGSEPWHLRTFQLKTDQGSPKFEHYQNSRDVDLKDQNATLPSTTSASGPKISMFAKKSGFVIPKNKLSGSLVPIHRGTKNGDAELVREEATNQVARKTKWGPDLTLDTCVRKGRALAYQTRINQISEQLTLGTTELERHCDSLSMSDHQFSKEESDLLELERREIIGEVLKLNPAYKAPADYKPLLKEAKVPIPIKEHPGYNFIGLVFGPANDTQKRLEKETGAKIQVYGIKSDARGKVEITPTDGKEIDNVYQDLYVQVSADTFEKIDAAVALIELLLTTVSVNPVPSSTTPTSVPDTMNTNQKIPSPIISPASTNQGTTQPPPPQVQLPQYPQQWIPPNQAPLISNITHTATMPSQFAIRPAIASSFSPVMQNPSAFPSRPQTAVQPPYMPLGQTEGPRNNIPGPSLSGPRNIPTGPQFGPPQPETIHFRIQPSVAQPIRPGAFPQSSAPNSIFRDSQSFDTVKPSPSSGDFTFQPHNRPPNAASQVWQSNLRPEMGNLNPSFVQSFRGRQINHPRAQIEMNFAVNRAAPHQSTHLMMPTASHMQPRNFINQPHMNNRPGPFPMRPMQILENPVRPQHRFSSSPYQHFGSQHGRPFSGSSGGQQVYDPFSPTSVPPFNIPQMRGNMRGHGESDPEYEDLMASVGVQ